MKRDAETLSKKKAIHPRGEAARARKNFLEAQRRDLEARELEDQQWRKAEDNRDRRLAKKREEEAQKRAEKAAWKAATRQLAEQEEMDLRERLMKKLFPVPPYTSPEEAEKQRQQWWDEYWKGREVEMAKKKVVDANEYKRMVLESNGNGWDDSVLEEKGIEEAIRQIRLREFWPRKYRHGTKQIVATCPGKPRKSFVCVAEGDGEERVLMVDGGGICSRSGSDLDLFEYYPLERFGDRIDYNSD